MGAFYHKRTWVLLLVLLGALALCISGVKQPPALRMVVPKGWPKPVYTFQNNKLTEAGFQLGKALFYDPRLSKDGTISCASCHTSWSAFTHIDHSLSHGINGLVGKRNSLVLVNLAWNKAFMWDGGVNNLEVQPLAPITHVKEMDNTLANIVKTLDTMGVYKHQFYTVFGDSTITGQHILKALAQFLACLTSYNAPYDQVKTGVKGKTFTAEEQRGYALYKSNCSSCHPEPLFTDYSYRNIGLLADDSLKDWGRMLITGNSADSLKFKVPTLRNVAISFPYMHDGRFRTLQQVLRHYSQGIVSMPGLAPALSRGLPLSDQDQKDIIAFLGTLTDVQFINNKRYAQPTLP